MYSLPDGGPTTDGAPTTDGEPSDTGSDDLQNGTTPQSGTTGEYKVGDSDGREHACTESKVGFTYNAILFLYQVKGPS